MFIWLLRGFFDSANDSAVWIAMWVLIALAVLHKMLDYRAEK